jgi:phosphatidylglycerol:prolipoprotein diacylglycerol transferase
LSRTVLFALGPLHLYRYGFTVALGLLAGLWLALREARRRGFDADALFDLCLAAVAAGLVGARAEHVLFSLPFYLAHPAEILRLDEGGLSIHGALFAGALAVWVVGRRRNLPFLTVADLLAAPVALGEAIGRLGCDLVGRVTTWPLALVVDGVRYHNVPLYTSVYLFGLFAYLYGYRRTRVRVRGQLLLEYVLWYSVGRFLLEFVRSSPTVWLGLSLAQLVSLLLALLAAFGLRRLLAGPR